MALWVCFLTPMIALGTFFQPYKIALPMMATGMKPAAFCSLQDDFNGRFAFTSNDKVIASVSQKQGGGTRTISYVAFNPKTGARLPEPMVSETQSVERQLFWAGLEGSGLKKLTFSPNGRYVLEVNSGAGQQETLYCRELATGKIRWTRVAPYNVGQNSASEALTISPDGRFVAIAYAEAIVIRNLETGMVFRQINRRNDFYKNADLQFSPDSRLLGDAHANGIAIWDWRAAK